MRPVEPRKLLVLALIVAAPAAVIIDSPILAADDKSPEKVEGKTEGEPMKRTEDKRRAGSRGKDSTDNEAYSQEFGTSLSFDTTSGSVKSADQESSTELANQRIGATLMYGWLATEHIEPFIEFQYTSVTRKVAEFTSTEVQLDTGVGMLVNLPQSESDSGGPPVKLQNVRWIPYVGLLFGTSKLTDGRALTSGTVSVSDSGTFTKFMFGTRWMIYPHVSMNFGFRFLYEKSVGTVEVPDKKGASRSRTQLEAQMFSLSLFI